MVLNIGFFVGVVAQHVNNLVLKFQCENNLICILFTQSRHFFKFRWLNIISEQFITKFVVKVILDLKQNFKSDFQIWTRVQRLFGCFKMHLTAMLPKFKFNFKWIVLSFNFYKFANSMQT